MSATPKHLLRPQHRLSGQSLLSHMHIEDEEEEMEEEELVTVIHPSAFSQRRPESGMEQDELEILNVVSSSKVSNTCRSPYNDMVPFSTEHHADSYYLEPLLPAIPKAAKEKSISLNKEEESGESHHRAAATTARKAATNVPNTSQRKAVPAESNLNTFIPIPVVESGSSPVRPHTEESVCHPENKQPHGFFLHLSEEPHSYSTPLDVGQDSDSDIADLDEDEDEDDHISNEGMKRQKSNYSEDGELCEFGEGESAKLREDLKVSERDDKEDCSGHTSPCLSTVSWTSSCSASGSASVKMTSFAERKLLKLGLRDGFSSTSSSQKTTPDGSEVVPCPPWQLKNNCSPSLMGKEPVSFVGKNMVVSPSVVPSELLQLHMQLEEQRRAIEYQKKKMETLSARQRLKLGKAAFLNIVKGGGKSDTLPLPLKHSESVELADKSRVKSPSCRDDSCLDALKVQANTEQTEGGQTKRDNRLSKDNGAEPNMSECSHSIGLLNEAISSIQQQMMQLSFQQDLLMKHVVSPPEQVESDRSTNANTTQPMSSTSDSRGFAVHFVDIGDSCTPARRPPKLTSNQRRKTLDRKESKDNKMLSVKSNHHALLENSGGDQKMESVVERSIYRNTTFRVSNDLNQCNSQEDIEGLLDKTQSQDQHVVSSMSMSPSQPAEEEENKHSNSGNEAVGGSEIMRVKGQLIEVDLSELKDPLEDGNADVEDLTVDSEQKNVMGFFFKVKFCILMFTCPHIKSILLLRKTSSSRMRRKQRMKWQNGVPRSSSSNSAKQKKQDYVNSSWKPRVSSSVTRPGTFVNS